jgi:hypothetical protein
LDYQFLNCPGLKAGGDGYSDFVFQPMLKFKIGILMVAGANSSTQLTTTLLQRPRPFDQLDFLLKMENSLLCINPGSNLAKNGKN